MIWRSCFKLQLNTSVLEIEKIDGDDKVAWRVLTQVGFEVFNGIVFVSPYLHTFVKVNTAYVQYL